MKSLVVFLAPVAMGAAAACGSSGPAAPSRSSADAAAPATTLAFDMSVAVAPHAEAHSCQFVKMPDTGADIFVGGGSYTTTPGTHHFLLFRTAPVDPPPTFGAPVDCFEGLGLMRFERGFVTGGQARAESADFPIGAALAFKPGEILLLQGHFLNPGESTLQAGVHVEMRTVDASTVTARVGTYRFYDPYIYVAPHAAASATMRCHLHHDVTILSAGSHMHRRGVHYRAFFDPSSTARADAPFFTTDDWQHPPFWRGPLAATAGSALRFECDYQNADDHAVTQGTSAEDEMCMLSAFYVPEQPDDENDCVSMDMHGSGTSTCAETTSCLALCSPNDAPDFTNGKASVGACWQKCIVASCPNVTEALFPQLECTKAQCATECATFDATCTACVVARCKPQLDLCQALACGN